MVRRLDKIIATPWRSWDVPNDWETAVTAPIHKKGSKSQCKNYRGISLLTIPGNYMPVFGKKDNGNH